MRGLTHRWIEPKAHATDPARRPDWGGALHPLVRRILAARGCSDAEHARAMCDPRLTALHRPGDLPGCDDAAARILAALRAREKIVVYADYDVDGVCAGAILIRTLRLLDPDAEPSGRLGAYIPHRLDEGYGLNPEAVGALADEGTRLIVTVDCGITARREASLARERNIDLIVTDHHEPPADGAGLPDAAAIVHPRVPGPGGATYPFGELCGAGVAYKLAWRLLTLAHGSDRLPEDQRAALLDLLALAGLATIADVVPLVDENRVIARFGLSRVKSAAIVGLGALVEASGLAKKSVGSEEAGFALGPRLNACGRMGHAREALELFLTDSPERAAEIAGRLDRANTRRRAVEAEILEQADEMARAAGMTGPDRRAIVLAREGWSPGVVGIVCSRLVGRYSRPTLLLERAGDVCRGSGRSVDGFDLHGALSSLSDRLESFGGHEMAAGLAVRADAFEGFAEAFVDRANALTDETMLTPSIAIDCEAALDELTADSVRQIERLGPFGRANPAPTLLLRGVGMEGRPETMGARGKHLAVRVRQGPRVARLVGWGWGERVERLATGSRLDVVLRPRLNEWNGRVSVEGEIRDLRVV